MLYEETVIDGVLHWRGKPNGEWTAKTQQQLTQMLLEARRERLHMQQHAPVFVQPFVVYPAIQPTPKPAWKPPYEVTC